MRFAALLNENHSFMMEADGFTGEQNSFTIKTALSHLTGDNPHVTVKHSQAVNDLLQLPGELFNLPDDYSRVTDRLSQVTDEVS